ncbi:CoA pyrophosphatase [Salipiger sp.]|uniref:CoA pyrophosphatase n=1 Tax=Salipiger sp. TaxID=2078585 RepID=UPI003A968EF4
MTGIEVQIDALRRAVSKDGPPSSDFDLNPETLLPPNRKLRAAGVLVAFLPGPDGLELLLTKRSPKLVHHPGQIAFPGGKQDPRDADPVAAALREAHEEVGLDPALVEVFGTLPAHETVTGFLATPVVGLVRQGFTPVAEPGEVAEIFRVPYRHVMTPDRYTVQGREWRGQRRLYYAVPFGPYYIWGATARMLRALVARINP